MKTIIGPENISLALLRFVVFRRITARVERRTILVYRTARLGDFIVAIPGPVALWRRFPSARIVLLTTASTMLGMPSVTETHADPRVALPWLLFVTSALVDEAVAFSVESWKAGLMQTRQRVRGLQPQATFILQFS